MNNARPTATGLYSSLCSAGFAKQDLPDGRRRSQWLTRTKRTKILLHGDMRPGAMQSGQKHQPSLSTGSLPHDSAPVELARAHLLRLPTAPPAEQSGLFALSSSTVTCNRVYVSLCNRALIRHIQNYAHNRIHLSVDRKMKCLKHGWDIATISLLVRNDTRATATLSRNRHQRIEGKAFTLNAKPLLHAVMHEETTENWQALFRDADQLWEQYAPGAGRMSERVAQVLKDFAAGIEAARRLEYSFSRPCDDFSHLAQKDKVIDATCGLSQASADDKSRIDDMAGITKSFLRTQRHAPTVDIVSAFTRGMLTRVLFEFYLPDLHAHLLLHVRELPIEAAIRMRLDPRATGQHSLLFPTYWTGIFGMFPATASGNEAGDAIHSNWETDVEAHDTHIGLDEANPDSRSVTNRQR